MYATEIIEQDIQTIKTNTFLKGFFMGAFFGAIFSFMVMMAECGL